MSMVWISPTPIVSHFKLIMLFCLGQVGREEKRREEKRREEKRREEKRREEKRRGGLGNTPLAELALGEPFFCLVFWRDSFIQGKICFVRVGFGAREDNLDDDLAVPPLPAPPPPLPPGCWVAFEAATFTAFWGGETWGGGWCSGGRLGRMQLPLSSFVLACWGCGGALVPSDCREHADLW